ncbi:MAG: trans-sulfuration enzyme family protein [Candidatus Polarisedimenticolia bacterium]
MATDHRSSRRIETLAVHGGEDREGHEGSLVFPIYQGTVYTVEPGTGYDDIKYHRLSTTPSQRYLHGKLAALEGGEDAVATSSGMAALTTIMLSHLRKGDHLLAGDCLYGGTHGFLLHHAADLGLSYTFIDPHDPSGWEAARTPSTRMIVMETITNPLMRVPLLGDLAAFARRHGLVSVVDNTFASPVNFHPLAAGFDLVYHSATKYLNGHSDLVGGCVVGSAERVTRVRKMLNHLGGTMDPHAGYMLARGIKTLALRVGAQNRNALALAGALQQHPKVQQVNYPGLESHPDHALAREMLAGFGGMLSFRPRGGTEAAEKVLASVTLPFVAPSLGGVESLMTRPAVTSHAGLSVEERKRAGVTDDLIRVSCGIEDAQDLVEDMKQALDRI